MGHGRVTRGAPYLPRVLGARLQRDGARQVGGDLKQKGGEDPCPKSPSPGGCGIPGIGEGKGRGASCCPSPSGQG